ncbi:MAG: glycosyltransferase family 4 protein, partial [Muribaculaceae bacterium]|nr:glycosyltransferase family 4 protein [Muribaculaceae bacterium]
IDFGEGNGVYNLWNIWRLKKIIKEYDVVHTHNYSPQIFAAISSLGRKVKLVTTEHGGSNRRRSHRWFVPIDRWMYKQYDKVICIADKTLNNLTDFIGDGFDNMTVINNGVDISKFSKAEPSPELESIAPKSKKIMMVAGFRWEKDQDTLIAALTCLPEDFHLFLVGDGVRRQELEMLTSDKGLSSRVHFLGVRSDIPQLLQASDYIVMSSHFEGLSLSSVEGMSVGKPFLASDVDGLREVVNGAGVLFPHQNPEALANEILKLYNNQELYQTVAAACKERAMNYDISNMVNGYTEVYRKLLE